MLNPQTGLGIALPDDDDLKADLTSARVKRVTSKSQRVLEEKAEARRRLGRSPDAGDATVQVLTGYLFEQEQASGGDRWEVFRPEEEGFAR